MNNNYTKIMSRKRLSTKKAKQLIENFKNKPPKIVFYTDKLKITLPNEDALLIWKKRFPSGKVRFA